MKYLVLVPDGMADYPVPQLNNQTPLQASRTPYFDQLASQGTVGLVQTIPPGMSPGSDVANLAVLGYNPKIYYTGRSPLEAASIGVELQPTDVTLRCNLVTLSDESEYSAKTMLDYSADEITTAEAAELITTLAKELNTEKLTFYSGTSYRHLLVWHDGLTELKLTPPHDISDQKITNYLPQGFGSELLQDLMLRSQAILAQHPINLQRIARGLRPANSIWLWGQGTKPKLTSFTELYQVRGAVISAVDLAKGLGICAGLKVIEVAGATGNIHTNFRGKAEAALKVFRDGYDFVYLHYEAPDEAGHRGEVENKVLSLEKIDEVLGLILQELPEIDPNFRIMILPDHPTPLVLKTHTSDPVPFIIYDSKKAASNYSVDSFNEQTASQTGLLIKEGHTLIQKLFEQNAC